MKILKNEKILLKAENDRITLTTHRLREDKKSVFGDSIKSIMLEQISASEMRTIKNNNFLNWAIGVLFLLNGFVFLFNNYLITAELSKFFFGPNKIPPTAALTVLYISLILFLVFMWLYFISMKNVVSFHSSGAVINIQLSWFDADNRESLISKIEQAIDNRQLYLHNGEEDKNELN